MHLEHINMVVTDLQHSLRFYRAAFPHWEVRGQGQQEWFGVPRTWLHFGDDYHYLALNSHGTGENRDLRSNQLGLGHFAYVTDNIQAVIERLESVGFYISKKGQDSPFRRNVYFIDPDGYEIEFVQYLSDLPNERNDYE